MFVSILKKHIWMLAIAGFVIINVFLALSFFDTSSGPARADLSAINKDLDDLKSRKLENFTELSKYFSELAEAKGGEYAYELLRIAPMPPNTDMHLLGHTVGDVLYKQEGVEGIYKCTQDFRNACSHTIVVGLFFEKGEEALAEIAGICRNAPGGSGAYTMCFHGLGHGVLAYTGYNLETAAKLCERTGTREKNFREVGECVGGTIMEIIGGGFHDKVAWERERVKYLTKDNPLYPCSSDMIPELAKYQCFSYLTPHLFVSAGANLGNPTPDSFARSFTFCEGISPQNHKDRQACFGGFGKEFIVLAKQRDIRNMGSFSKEELETVHKWCRLAKKDEGIEYCIGGAVSSLFWGGENNPKVSVDFCAAAGSFEDDCFDILNANAIQYLSPKKFGDFCLILPESYKKICLQRSKTL